MSMTPGRLAEIEQLADNDGVHHPDDCPLWYDGCHCLERGALDLVVHIRDLEGQLTAAREEISYLQAHLIEVRHESWRAGYIEGGRAAQNRVTTAPEVDDNARLNARLEAGASRRWRSSPDDVELDSPRFRHPALDRKPPSPEVK